MDLLNIPRVHYRFTISSSQDECVEDQRGSFVHTWEY